MKSMLRHAAGSIDEYAFAGSLMCDECALKIFVTLQVSAIPEEEDDG
jgi:hypothetical protein